MSDIVERLQPWMDRVEYLRIENIRLEAENDRLRAALREAALHVQQKSNTESSDEPR